jgi:hypothetical protein
MTPEQFRRLSFALIGLFEDVPLDETLREVLERTKRAPEQAMTETELLHNVTVALSWAESTLAAYKLAAGDEPRVRAAILLATIDMERRLRVGPAQTARSAQAAANRDRAKQLRADSLSPARIAIQMTMERNKPDLPDIHTRTVERWLRAERSTDRTT